MAYKLLLRLRPGHLAEKVDREVYNCGQVVLCKQHNTRAVRVWFEGPSGAHLDNTTLQKIDDRYVFFSTHAALLENDVQEFNSEDFATWERQFDMTNQYLGDKLVSVKLRPCAKPGCVCRPFRVEKCKRLGVPVDVKDFKKAGLWSSCD